MDNVTLITDATVTDVNTDDTKACVTLMNGKQLYADLVIAADSRLSGMRRMLGIGAHMHDFGRTVIVFRVTHPLSNHGTAQECFFVWPHFGTAAAERNHDKLCHYAR